MAFQNCPLGIHQGYMQRFCKVACARYLEIRNGVIFVEIKTYKRYLELRNQKVHFDEYVLYNDLVDNEMAEYFGRNSGAVSKCDFIQSKGYLGFDEEHIHRRTYRTFQKENGNWRYCGYCFANENDHEKVKGFTLSTGGRCTFDFTKNEMSVVKLRWDDSSNSFIEVEK